MKKVIIFITFCLLVTGCAGGRSPDITREEWLSMSSHVFPKTKVNDVLINAEKVMRYSDPSDVHIFHQQNKMIATRKYFVYAVLAVVTGHYSFDVTAHQQGDDVVTQLLISDLTQNINPMLTAGQGGIGATAGAGLVSGYQTPWKESYDLFFSRVESLLYSKPWVTCEAIRENTNDVFTESMCLLADDKIPEGIQLSERSAQIVAKRELNKQLME